MRTATATCHTDECPSAGQPVPGVVVELELDDETITVPVCCGACGQPIDDLVDDVDQQPGDDQTDTQTAQQQPQL